MFKEEKNIENKTCKHCSCNFTITDKDLEFYEKISPSFWWQKYLIPSPTLCPDCRQQRRLLWRNRRKMYKRKCDATWKEIISMFSPDKPYNVYYTKFWESDSWDPFDYWKTFDFNKSFFEQFNELLLKIPLPHLAIIESSLENSEYINWANSVKNSYLSSNIVWCENVYYSSDIYFSKNCIDCSFVTNCENCSNCLDSLSLFSCYNVKNSENLINCEFCNFCKNCNNCFWCIWLENKSYSILNKQYNKNEYEELIEKFKSNFAEFWELYKELQLKHKYKNLKILNSENAIWENIFNSKNIVNSFEISDSENIKNSFFIVWNSNNLQDISFWWENISYCYEWVSIWINSKNVLFSAETYDNVRNSFYCYFCYPNNSNLFGCIWLKNKQYCILNKQYTKEEYEMLVPKIIEHMQKTWEWWEFFPSSISPFWYNETVANEYFPIIPPPNLPLAGEGLDKFPMIKFNSPPAREGLGEGFLFNWSTYEPPFPQVEKIIKASMLPEDISKIPDDILNWAIECEITKKPFRIIKQELEFYRKHCLPIPRRHPDQRHLDRMNLRNPRKLFDRKCDKCGKDIKTTYAPDRKEIVYCESCYLEII